MSYFISVWAMYTQSSGRRGGGVREWGERVGGSAVFSLMVESWLPSAVDMHIHRALGITHFDLEDPPHPDAIRRLGFDPLFQELLLQ